MYYGSPVLSAPRTWGELSRSGWLGRRVEKTFENCGVFASPLVRDFGSYRATTQTGNEITAFDIAPEVTVLATQAEIDILAERIEQAYQRRWSKWNRGCSTSRVWNAAAAVLVQLNRDDPSMPIDPELYVAAQPSGAAFQDPWTGLTQPSSARRYRECVGALISRLRSELRKEVRRAEKRCREGETLSQVLRLPGKYLSPLGCYIVAIRAKSPSLAARFHADALAQHRSCPLYRAASLSLIDASEYPGRQPAGGRGIRRNDRPTHLSNPDELSPRNS